MGAGAAMGSSGLGGGGGAAGGGHLSVVCRIRCPRIGHVLSLASLRCCESDEGGGTGGVEGGKSRERWWLLLGSQDANIRAVEVDLSHAADLRHDVKGGAGKGGAVGGKGGAGTEAQRARVLQMRLRELGGGVGVAGGDEGGTRPPHCLLRQCVAQHCSEDGVYYKEAKTQKQGDRQPPPPEQDDEGKPACGADEACGQARCLSHCGYVFAVAACGNVVCSAGGDGLIKVWDARSQLLVATLTGHRGNLRGTSVGGV